MFYKYAVAAVESSEDGRVPKVRADCPIYFHSREDNAIAQAEGLCSNEPDKEIIVLEVKHHFVSRIKVTKVA